MGLRRLLREAGGKANDAVAAHEGSPDNEQTEALLADLCDDLNTPKALATLWTALRDNGLSDREKCRLAAYADGVLSLGLFDFVRLEALQDVPDPVRRLAEDRWVARQARNYAESDRLRDLIAAQGYVVRDRRDGYELERARG